MAFRNDKINHIFHFERSNHIIIAVTELIHSQQVAFNRLRIWGTNLFPFFLNHAMTLDILEYETIFFPQKLCEPFQLMSFSSALWKSAQYSNTVFRFDFDSAKTNMH